MSEHPVAPDLPDAAPSPTGWRRLSGHALIYLGAAALNALIPFLILPLMARWLGPADFGVVGNILAMITVLALLIGLNTQGLISVVFFRDGPRALPRQVGASFGVLVATGLPVLILLYAGAGVLEDWTGIPQRWLWTIWLAACGQFAVSVALVVWQTRGQPWRYGATQVGFSLATAGLSVLLVGWFAMGLGGRAAGQAVGAAAVGLLGILALTAARAVDWNPGRWPLRTALNFGLPLIPHSLAVVVITSIDRLALSGTHGTSAAGHYVAAFQIASVLSVFATAVNQAWLPWLYGNLARNDAAARRSVVRATYALYALLLAGAGLLAMLSPFIVSAVLGPQFAPSTELLILLAPAAAFSGMYFFASGYLFYTSNTVSLAVISVTAAILQACLVTFLAGIDGARGVALATLLSSFLYWAMVAIVAQHVFPMPWLTAFSRPSGSSQ